MSAFQVSPNHIGAILRWYLFDGGVQLHYRAAWREKRHPDTDDAMDMAACLAFECWRSVNHRYPNAQEEHGCLPGPEEYDSTPVMVDTSNLGVYRKLTAIEAIKACHCLAYQSCEHDEWDKSEAKKLLDDIVESTIPTIPGYNEAPWHIDDRAPNPVYSLSDMARKRKR